MNNLDPLLSAQELADYLEVPLATLYAWRYRGDGPPGFRAGKHLRYRKSDIDQWINDRMEYAGPPALRRVTSPR
jgi:excisionase family DNA binding protein